jgi:uncharacterized protein (DUF302 family)
MKLRWLVLAFAFFAAAAGAGPAGVIRLETRLPLAEAFERVSRALESEKFRVVFEADMGERMARFKDAWGIDYNRNDLGGIKSMVFCNIEWTNRIANADPDLLALCPLHLTLFDRNGTTQVVLPRFSLLAKGSPGETRAAELEGEIRRIVESALEK